jgi:integrase/recombinase XerD
VQDVNFQNGEVFVRPVNASSKNKSRTLRIGAATTKALWRYLAEREEQYPGDALFLSEDNNAITRNGINQLMKRIGKSAGIKPCYPHRFRHTFAIQFLRNGGDVFSLQHALGHTDWTMTRHYSNLAESDFANTHRRASPVDNWRL